MIQISIFFQQCILYTNTTLQVKKKDLFDTPFTISLLLLLQGDHLWMIRSVSLLIWPEGFLWPRTCGKILIWLGHFGIWLLPKNLFVKIEVCGKNIRFFNISENTMENLIILSGLIILFLSFLGILSVCPDILCWGR